MECWNCGAEMISREDDRHHPYLLCPQCGATHTEVPELGPDPLADHGYYIKDESGVRVGRARSPRPIRKARKAAKA